ncbi:MAG: hybrid sensor histidine kinase/response regulator [Rhodospirillales bacterium]
MPHQIVDLALVFMVLAAALGWLWAVRRGRAEDARRRGRDVTERKRAEEALQESEKRLRLFTDAMPALFSYVDKDRRYRFCNLQYEKHFRRKRDRIIGRTMAEVLGAGAYGQVKHIVDRAFGGENVFYEQWVDFREAGRTYIRGSLIPDVAASGEVEGFFAMAQDMTAKKRAEDRLARAKEKAEETSASKSRFLAAASHDLRQPMQALAMFIEVLAGRPHDRESRDIIEKIQASSKALERLLNALLDISKLEADLVVPDIRRFRLGELTTRLAEEIGPLADADGLALRHVPSGVAVMSDPGLLDRSLRHLLNNAVANTDKGRILFGCRRRDGAVAIEVWDTGSGISDDQKPRIFEEFYQGGEGDRGNRSGLGLGLAIVDRLVGLLDHRIEVETELGKGSVFRVLVPVAEAAAAVPTPPPPRFANDANGALIVGIDDDPAVRDALSLLLESWGFEAVIAASEQEAVSRLTAENRTPDLVIADYRLQRGDRGSNAIHAIRRRWGLGIPGLLLTGDTDPLGLEEASASGFHVVKKPIQPEKLKAVVAEHMESQAGAGGPSTAPRAAPGAAQDGQGARPGSRNGPRIGP